ncbi:PREDICTED: myb family transcription factor EFM isoform X2 [Tarenaya hassleriana]|uniref:myb family transcription factor EFM isoform X2 n=1 Tax=Tarenaya hassleriana TaxID=28532 RepID=UPI00053C2ECC|nr:PREDICTED: myb family transcription factor EFM isoform X2 [Tarenaya hassleriana]
MGSLGDELSLDLRPSFQPRTISDFLKEVSAIGDVSERVSKLEDFVKEFEGEMKKIDGFKRELPLCMLLLNDAISFLKEETKKFSARNVGPVLEEFIPLKKRNREEEQDKDDEETEDEEEKGNSTKWIKRDKETREKTNWVSSFQLWKPDYYTSNPVNRKYSDHRITCRVESKRNEENLTNGSSSRPFLPCKGFESFSSRNGEEEISSAQRLSLLSPAMKNGKEETGSSLGLVASLSLPSSAPEVNLNAQSVIRLPPPSLSQQTSRKQRRCWSPDLHRSFLNALQELGGPQVATPKQIRELMQVEGLTNDEVKSHLQKYRLHARKLHPGNSNSSETLEKQSVVVLGGKLWNSGENSKGSSPESGSPQGPLLLAMTTTTGGDSMEEDEETKSESFSWRDHHDSKHAKA